MASFHHRVKSGSKGAAADHAAYIARQGKHRNREDLVLVGAGNLPDWAAQDPAVFWKAADRYERANGASYREHEIALPGELSLEQQRELVLTIVGELIGERKTYQYAIHTPESSLDGRLNTHVHLMFSDRTYDGIPRPPERMFSRYNRNDPAKGGCRKASGGRSPPDLRDEVIGTRKTIADLQNAALAKYGHPARVDHRSLKQQGQTRAAERHLGPARIRRMSDADKRQILTNRTGNALESWA